MKIDKKYCRTKTGHFSKQCTVLNTKKWWSSFYEVVHFLRGGAVTGTLLGGLTINFLLQISFSLCLPKIITRKPSCRWQTRATLAKSLHGLRKSSGVVSCVARLPIDSVPMVCYYVLCSNCVCKMRRFGDTRLLKLPWPWNPGQGSLKVIETDTIR